MSMVSSGVNPGVIALWAIEADQATPREATPSPL
jgi:hypothetical protein